MRFLPVLIASLILPACVDSEADYIDITPVGGKADGVMQADVTLQPSRPTQSFGVVCNNRVDCDLELRLVGAPEGTEVVVTLEDTSKHRFVDVAVQCTWQNGTPMTEHRLVPPGQTPANGMRCSDVPHASVTMPDGLDLFRVEVTKKQWAPDEHRSQFVLRVAWN